jgi:Ni2+-binding GTPase involved in maturation of urease and hydrogenase
MRDPIRFGCVGGFLGAGKTTALAAAARELQARGHTVGLVANDQGKDLVDTAVFRGLGLPAGEVAGGCFCCRFDDLVAEADRILAAHPVDVLLAEAVGSCTDLVATVYRPLRRFFPGRFELLPFSVLVEPGRVAEMSRPEKGVPADVAYIFERQLAEADLLLLTKADLVPPAARADVRRSIESVARGVPVLEASAATGEGVAAWLDRLLGRTPLADRGLEIDYDAYARGEAALAWLNAAVEVRATAAISPRAAGEALMGAIRDRARQAGLVVPHVKVLVATTRGSARLAVTRASDPPRWEGDPDLPAEPALTTIVNARAVAQPDAFRALVADAIGAAGRTVGAGFAIERIDCFSPSRPVPRHRLDGPSGSEAIGG